MKKLLLSFILLFSLLGHAQKDIHLIIQHRAGANFFKAFDTLKNNLDNSFFMDRMDYYLSDIRLIHDGGQEITIPSKYILVKTDMAVDEDLGSFNITNLEGIRFGIGVDSSVNHLDPATYPSTHPLAFQSPSMHWGWASGYRFVATQGNMGSKSQTWELHALGDKNYGYAVVMTSGKTNGSEIDIVLDADYQEAFRNIQVDGNLNYHGEDLEAPILLDNFQNHVFSEATSFISIEEAPIIKMRIGPNPSSGIVHYQLSDNSKGDIIELRDLSGRIVSRHKISVEGRGVLEISSPGIYLMSVIRAHRVIATEKIVVR